MWIFKNACKIWQLWISILNYIFIKTNFKHILASQIFKFSRIICFVVILCFKLILTVICKTDFILNADLWSWILATLTISVVSFLGKLNFKSFVLIHDLNKKFESCLELGEFLFKVTDDCLWFFQWLCMNVRVRL